MQTITLYRYTRPDGGVSTSPVKPDAADYTIKYRLIADEGMAITDGDIITMCVDTDTVNEWTEIEYSEEE